MATDINQCVFSGRLTVDPEHRVLPNGNAMLKFCIAINKSVKINGEWENKACFLNVVCWGFVAKSCQDHLSKGCQVIIIGELEQNSWQDRDGNKRSVHQLTAQKVRVIGDSQRSSSYENSSQSYGYSDKEDQNRAPVNEYENYSGGDDVPF